MQSPDNATQAMLEQIMQLNTALLTQAVPCAPQALYGLIASEVAAQPGYERVLEDLADANAQKTHPYWGFFIVTKNPETGETAEIARTLVPKVLDPKAADYLAQLAAWTNTYMLAVTPAVRAAWRAVGFTVNFFQTAQAPTTTPAQPKLTLVR
jgi:hypothetical protein